MQSIDELRLRKLDRDFYERETLDVAKDLLGKYLVHNVNNNTLVCRITETEAYKENDKAAHFYGGRRTDRTEVIFGRGGFAYVYLIYGMYNCFNVTTEKEGVPGAVLVRGVEPIFEIEEMLRNRKMTKDKIKNLANGPGKLCVAMNITREQNKMDLLGDELFIAEALNEINEYEIKCGKRINIDYAEECKDFLWRFYI
jgi:DNA-3-methyladenine glycosylase